jgi:hypothetical protein
VREPTRSPIKVAASLMTEVSICLFSLPGEAIC